MKRINILMNDQNVVVKAEKLSNMIWFQWEGFIYALPYKVSSVKNSTTGGEKKVNENQILSDIPGQVVKVLVSAGQQVVENQTLIVLSSMKMEYTVKASYSSRVKVIKIKESDMVTAGQELIELEKK